MATRLGKRPHPKNYAMYDARGKAKYRKDLAEYHEKKKKIEAEKNKLSTKKNLDKQKTANKKAVSTPKTKTTTKSKAAPKSTATKAKSLATGKTTSKTKAVETPQTKTATKTRTRTRTQTKSKTTTNITPKSKTPTKTTPKSKTPVRTTNKQPTKQPAKRGRPVGSKNKPKGNQTLKIAGDGAKKTGKFLKNTAKQAYDLGKKGVNKLQTKLSAKDQTPQQSVPEGKSKGAKVAKKLNQKISNYAKRVYNKAALDTFKFKTVMKDPSKRATNRAGVRGGLVSGGALLAGNALINRLTKPKGMTLKEWNKKKAEMEQASYDKRRKAVVKAGTGLKNLVKKGVNKIRG